jgi:CRISPR-associated protein Csm3
MRAELEKQTGTAEGANPSKQGPVARVFGPHFDTRHQEGPTRIRVHDAPLMSGSDFALELKTESVNNRQTGTAMHPRTLERVAPGAKFQLRIDFDVYDIDQNFQYTDMGQKSNTGRDAILAVINDGLDLICRSGVGSATSRGYGQIQIDNDKVEPAGHRSPLRFPDQSSGAAS